MEVTIKECQDAFDRRKKGVKEMTFWECVNKPGTSNLVILIPFFLLLMWAYFTRDKK